ncbi:MAG: carbon-nitrogen hydrolase family protein [Acidobacteriota bacterium]|nr:carbon-nitrogen hydrolase family protein [Acidobacteriota bacterium]
MNLHRLLLVVCLCNVTAFAQARANLVPNPEFRVDPTGQPISWQFWSPRPDLRPRADVAIDADGAVLRLTAIDFSSFGKWLSKDIPVTAGHFYRFQVLYRPTDIVNERGSVGVMLTWNTADGQPVQRDYVDSISAADSGWRSAARTLGAPEKATSVTLELWLRWAAEGSVRFRSPSLIETGQPPPRSVRVVTTRIPVRWGTTVHDNLQSMAEVLDRAGRAKPDVVLLTEIFPDCGVKGTVYDLSEPIPGPVTEAVARKAREYHTYLITGMLEREGGKAYDTAVLIDRQGRIAGKYRKVHLPLAEVEGGETPGSEYPVFDTDFGRIGILICWDMFFPETARILRLAGANIVFVPIAGDPGARHYDVTTRARALDNGVYLVTSVGEGRASRIVNPNGEVMAETTDGLATADIDLGKKWREWWLSVGPAYGEAKSLVIEERRPDTYKVLVKQGQEPGITDLAH